MKHAEGFSASGDDLVVYMCDFFFLNNMKL